MMTFLFTSVTKWDQRIEGTAHWGGLLEDVPGVPSFEGARRCWTGCATVTPSAGVVKVLFAAPSSLDAHSGDVGRLFTGMPDVGRDEDFARER